MRKFDGVLLVSDIDGTLFGNDYRLSPQNAEALEYFKSEGGRFTLASGRSLNDVAKIGESLCNTYFIGYNGVVVGNKTERLFEGRFNNKLIPILERVAKEQPYSDIEFVSDNGIFAYRANEFTNLHKTYVSDSVFESISRLEDAPDNTRMIAFWMDSAKMEDFSRWFEKQDFSGAVTGFQGFRYSYECVPFGCNKGAAARLLAQKIGAKLLVTAGDNCNDVSMLQAADLSFAPKNAASDAKAAAKQLLTRDADHSILPEILEKLQAVF